MVSLLVQASKSKLDEILLGTKSDIELQSVANYIENGWPESKSVVLHAQHYWHCQTELHIKNGLICRGQRFVIPKSCRKDVLQRLHIGHRGIVSCINLARQSLYWPGMNTEIENMVSHCDICQQNQKSNCKELRKLAERPWQKVAIDFFHLSSVTYLLIVDYFLNILSSNIYIIQRPLQIIEFCTNRDIFFNPSSSGFPRSNGQDERCVQTVKSTLVKAAQDKNDAHLVLMEYRNTHMDGLPSPAEILMGRRIRALIPTLPSQFDPHYDCSVVQERLHFRQQRQHKYDLHSRPLKPLQENQEVVFHLNNQ
ncbi:Uncharacterized protein K02A2.6 [Araneus ventricosus]|uniref:RNA-directed DNA polymerase n=1 Tax=Araneus ventricosus TaxID=182803 RepID=A0A4Y2VYF1_ARAVE|nr:Uncharacterized protein K02A2.6 [Araneus ventricosus]